MVWSIFLIYCRKLDNNKQGIVLPGNAPNAHVGGSFSVQISACFGNEHGILIWLMFNQKKVNYN